mgnify:CR=1 FL=1
MADVALAEADLWVGEMRGVVVRGEPLVVVRGEGGVCVYRDRCPHQGYPMSEGTLQGHVLTCRVHSHTFDATTGEGINPPRPCLSQVPSRIENGMVMVDLPAKGALP